MRGGRSSILHYGPLIETNYLYAPTPNGHWSLNKSNNPSPLHHNQHPIKFLKVAIWTTNQYYNVILHCCFLHNTFISRWNFLCNIVLDNIEDGGSQTAKQWKQKHKNNA